MTSANPSPDTPPCPPDRAAHRLWLLLLIPAASALFFVFYTNEIWEDFFITFRHTENLVRGDGLVYQPGERVHGFTSVLNVLVPAVPLWIFGTLEASLWVYRICCLAALLGGLLALWNGMRERLGSGRWELIFMAALVATSVKVIAFTMNGQETGFLVGFFCLSIASALRFDEARAWKWMGIACAGLLYSRPDSPLYIAMVAGIAWSIFRGTRRQFLVSTAKSAGLAAACYAPWLIFAWAYYGSPIPHTVLAKAGDSVLVGGSTLGTYAAIWAQLPEMMADIFGPAYGIGGWPGWIGWGTTLTAWITTFLWVAPIKDRFARSCSFALFVTILYMAWLEVQRTAYPWYFGPASLLATVVAGRAAALAWAQGTRFWRTASLGGAGLWVAFTAVCFALSSFQLRIQQNEIEEHTRKAIGLWLRENSIPGDTVYLECMGYIGYYSGARILDYPGLVSPTVVKVRREQKAGFAELADILRPNWIVARRGEFDSLRSIEAIGRNYEIATVFDSTNAIDTYGGFAGEAMVRFDSVFVILKRKPGQN